MSTLKVNTIQNTSAAHSSTPAGTTTVTMTNAMGNANYAIAGTAGSSATDGFRVLGAFNTFTTTTFKVVSQFHGATPYRFDCELNVVAAFGD
jgi:hypothetical protein